MNFSYLKNVLRCRLLLILSSLFHLADAQTQTSPILKIDFDNSISDSSFFLSNSDQNTEAVDRFGQKQAAYWRGQGVGIQYLLPDSVTNEDFSISFWLKSSQKTRADIISFKSDSTNLTLSFNDYFGLWAFWNGDGDNGLVGGKKGDYFDGKWHNIVLSRTDSLIEFYLDNVLVSSAFYFESIFSEDMVLTIGGSFIFPFQGSLDQFELFDKYLTPDEMPPNPPFFSQPATGTLISGRNYNFTVAGKRVRGVELADTVAMINLDSANSFNYTVPADIDSLTFNISYLADNDSILVTKRSFMVDQPKLSYGYEWRLLTTNLPYTPRDGAGSVYFKGKFWLFGGWNPNLYERTTINDIWSSSDGIQWQFEGYADWEPRHLAGFVVRNDSIWMIGGDINQSHYQNDVWVSENGITWHQVTDSAPWMNRCTHAVALHNQKFFVMGGQQANYRDLKGDSVFNDVWTSNDGYSWTRVIDSASWPARGQIGGDLSLKGKIWIIGGGTYNEPRKFFNDTWSSDDGTLWTKVSPIAPWRPRQFHSVFSFDEKIWVLGGFGNHYKDLNDVWFTEDGISWQEVENSPWIARHAQSIFVAGDRVLMSCGPLFNNEIWELSKKIKIDLNLSGEHVINDGDSLVVMALQDTLATYQWLKNDTIVMGVHDRHLTIRESGSFRTRIIDQLGNVGLSEPILVKVKPAPQWLASTIELTDGDTLRLADYVSSRFPYNLIESSKNEELPDVWTVSDGVYKIVSKSTDGILGESIDLKVVFKPKIHLNIERDTTVQDFTILSTYYDPDYNYSWFLNNDSLPFRSHSIQIARSGLYRVSVTKISSSGFNDSKPIHINTTPFIDLNVTSDTAVIDEKFLLKGYYSDNYNYTWYLDGVSISNTHEIPIFRSGQYFLSVKKKEELSSVAKSRELNIIAIPDVGLNITNDSLAYSKSILLIAKPDDDYQYKWQRNGSELASDSSSLQVVASGVYSVLLTDKQSGYSSLSNTVNITFEPVVILDISTTEIPFGDSVRVKVSSNHAIAAVQVLRNNEPFITATESEFWIKESGNFVISIEDDIGFRGYSEKFTILYHPLLLNITTDSTISKLSPTILQPSASVPTGSILLWYLNGELLKRSKTSELLAVLPGGYHLIVLNNGIKDSIQSNLVSLSLKSGGDSPAIWYSHGRNGLFIYSHEKLAYSAIRIVNIQGQLMEYRDNLSKGLEFIREEFETSNYKPGIYIITIHMAVHDFHMKLLISQTD